MVSTTTPILGYRAEIDGLRAVSVLSVILFHAGIKQFSGGYVGVDVFFVISGYLITGIITSSLESGAFSIRDFYERRARRILPSLFVVILVCTALAIWMLLPPALTDYFESVLATTFFVSNFYFWQHTGYFAQDAHLVPLLHTWSLAVEEQFYIVYPFFLPFLLRRGRRNAMVALALVGLLSLFLAQFAAKAMPSANFYLSPTRAWELSAGGLVALWHLEYGRKNNTACGWIGLGLVLYAVLFYDQGTPFPSFYALVPVIGACLILLFVSSGKGVSRLLQLRPLVWIGLISYSAYLWHLPIFVFARIESEPGPWLNLGLISLSIALAGVTYRLVELPLRRRSGERVLFRGRVIPSAVAILAAMGGLSFFGVQSRGLPQRYSVADRNLAMASQTETMAFVRHDFHAAELAPFSDPTKKHVFIVGDSFAMDFYNALRISRQSKSYEISTFSIPVGCGNLYVKQDISKFRKAKREEGCLGNLGYRNPLVQRLLRKTDILVVASAWASWNLDFLAESKTRLEAVVPGVVFFAGTKQVGHIEIREWLSLSLSERQNLQTEPDPEVLAINAKIKRLVGARYIDMQAALCGPVARKCRPFLPDGNLKSVDGGHLTPAGAREVGANLPLLMQRSAAEYR